MKHQGYYPLGLLLLLLLLAGSERWEPPASAAEAVALPLRARTTLGPMPAAADNPTTAAGVELGRRLFFDPILSADSSISCGSCHQPERYFSDGRAVSTGIGGRQGRRSAPSLLNIGYADAGLFWDGRSATLEEQALHPIADPVEMGSSWPIIIGRLRHHPAYGPALRQVFGLTTVRDIEPGHVGRALAQYQRTLLTYDSKFDRVQRGEARFSPAEQRGWAIFFDADPGLPAAECNHCHNEPLFTDQAFANNGLDEAPNLSEFPDPGRGAISGRRHENGMFRVPSLRNIAATAPYMHDGRFATLQAVLDHYASGGHYAENVSPNVRPLSLSAADKQDLLAFLATLTDTSVVNHPHYQAPAN